jgi:hypothetical protein
VRNEVLHGVKKERNILHKKTRKTNWSCHIVRRNCLLIHVIKGKIEGRRRRRRRLKQLLKFLTEMRGYWILKEITLCRELALDEAGYGPVVRQIAE